MGNSNLARRLYAYLRWRNTNACHPDILAGKRRELAGRMEEAASPPGYRMKSRPVPRPLDLHAFPGDVKDSRGRTEIQRERHVISQVADKDRHSRINVARRCRLVR